MRRRSRHMETPQQRERSLHAERRSAAGAQVLGEGAGQGCRDSGCSKAGGASQRGERERTEILVGGLCARAPVPRSGLRLVRSHRRRPLIPRPRCCARSGSRRSRGSPHFPKRSERRACRCDRSFRARACRHGQAHTGGAHIALQASRYHLRTARSSSSGGHPRSGRGQPQKARRHPSGREHSPRRPGRPRTPLRSAPRRQRRRGRTAGERVRRWGLWEASWLRWQGWRQQGQGQPPSAPLQAWACIPPRSS